VWLGVIFGLVFFGFKNPVAWIIGFLSFKLLIDFFGHPRFFGAPAQIEKNEDN
jgi:hypothetical protein